MKLRIVSVVVMLSLITTNFAFSQDFTLKTFELPNDFMLNYGESFLAENGTIWYGHNQGVGRVDIVTGLPLPSLSGMEVDTVNYIRKDSQGKIWIMGRPHWNSNFSAIEGAGVVVENGAEWKHYFNEQSEFNGFLDVAGSAVWLRYGNSGLLKILPTDTITYADPKIASIKEIEYDPNSGFWAIDQMIVYRLSNTGVWETDTTFSNYSLQDIHIDAEGTKWIIEYNKIWNRVDGASNVYKPVNCPLLDGTELSSIVSDGLGNVYFGTWNKGVIVKTKTGWYQLDTNSGLPFNYVSDVQLDERKNIWVFTAGWVNNGGNYERTFFATALMSNGFPEDGELLHGIVFSDINNNGLQDLEEPGIPNQTLKLEPSNAYVISNSEGKFSFHPVEGENKISVQLKGFWEQGITPLAYTFTYPNASLPDFKMSLRWGEINDVAVSLVGSALRPGFDASYYFTVRNEGSISASTTLSFDHDPLLTFVSSSVAPSLVTNGHIEWPVTNLKSLQNTSLQAVFNLPASVSLGTVIKNVATVEALSGETELDDNLDSLETTVTGSFDPNDKLVSEGILEERYVEMDSRLTYTIRFQNTGTDTAFVVKIKDQIDAHLDITSLEILASSHEMDYSLDGRLLRFSFPNIKLPDVTHNEPKSHGYVRYSIKPLSTIADNTVVVNSAAIYFDFNEPVLTNEVSNIFVDELPVDEITGIEENLSNTIFYPNPITDNIVYLTEEATRFSHAELISMYGSSLQQFDLQKANGQLQLQVFPSGLYLLKLTDYNKKTVLTKVIINQ